MPTLVLHGDDDQIVLVRDSAMKSARLIRGAKEVCYLGAPHGITATHQDQINAELLAFLRSSHGRLPKRQPLRTTRAEASDRTGGDAVVTMSGGGG